MFKIRDGQFSSLKVLLVLLVFFFSSFLFVWLSVCLFGFLNKDVLSSYMCYFL